MSARRREMIAVLVENCDGRLRILSCPARELIARRGSMMLWPNSATPIQVPFAWVYGLYFKEIVA